MTRLTLLPVLVLLTSVMACQEETPCPPGQVIANGYCAVPRDAGSPTPADASALAQSPSAAGATDGAASDGAAAFGKVCATHMDCSGVASYCARQPGATAGYCTAPGCDTMPQICPMGWICFDVGLLAKGEPHICFRP